VSRPLVVSSAAVLVAASGCSGHASAPARRVAPPDSAAVAAVRRFAAHDHLARIVLVTCEAARRNGSRPCQAMFSDTCDTYAVRYDANHHVRVERVDGTCYWVELRDQPNVRLE
jgi:hypothetical protein